MPAKRERNPTKRWKRTLTSSRRAVRAAAAAQDPIQHVVLLILENRSFDHMLGCMEKEIAEIDGVLANGAARESFDPEGRRYPQQAGAAREVERDPMHEKDNVLEQIKTHNDGFVRDYAQHYPSSSVAERQEIMAYHDVGTLPALHELARDFTVCDQWHCSVPGPTWTNRLFALSGTSLGRVHMPAGIFNLNLHRYQQDTIFDRLRSARRSHRIYVGDFPLALLFEHERTLRAARDYADISAFYDDAEGDADAFPDFAFIEPRYLWPGVDDDHPPHDRQEGPTPARRRLQCPARQPGAVGTHAADRDL